VEIVLPKVEQVVLVEMVRMVIQLVDYQLRLEKVVLVVLVVLEQPLLLQLELMWLILISLP